MIYNIHTGETLVPSNISFMSRRQVKRSDVPVRVQFPGAGQQPVQSTERERYTLRIAPSEKSGH